MKNERNLMIDIECLSLKQDALIVELGAVFFTLNKDGSSRITSELGDPNPFKIPFSMSVNITEYIADRTMDAATVAWWIKQATKVQPVWIEDGYSLDYVLSEFVDFIKNEVDWDFKGSNAYNIWSHGSDFDIPILKNSLDAFKKFKGAFYNSKKQEYADLWDRRNVRDTRTLFDVAEFDYFAYSAQHNSEHKHSAVHDAITQANGVIAAFHKLHGIKEGE